MGIYITNVNKFEKKIYPPTVTSCDKQLIRIISTINISTKFVVGINLYSKFNFNCLLFNETRAHRSYSYILCTHYIGTNTPQSTIVHEQCTRSRLLAGY